MEKEGPPAKLTLPRASFNGIPFKDRWMAMAARLPAATASTTEPGIRAASPPAKLP